MAIDLSIIIVTFNVQELIAACLQSIIANETNISYEFIIIDNASTDNTVMMIENLNIEQLRLIKNNNNTGFAPANNQGLPFAAGDFLLYLNPDTIVPAKNTFRKMIEYMRLHPKVGIVGPRVIFADNRLQFSCGKMPTPFIGWMEAFSIPEKIFKFIRDYRYPLWNHAEIRSMDWLSGCCLFIRSNLAKKLGGFDENMLFYAEDIDLCTRAKLANAEIIYNPESTIIHLAGHSAKKDRYLSLSRGFYSKLVFFKKYYGILAAKNVQTGFWLSCFLKVVFLSITIVFNSKNSKEMLAAYLKVLGDVARIKVSEI